MEVRKLTGFTLEDQRFLGGFGYSSAFKYDVKKEVNGESTVIKTDLIQLETEYVKVYPDDDDEFERFRQLIPLGYSLGLFSDHELIAVAICEPYAWNNTLFIWHFQVAARRRRKGIGETLMKSLENLARTSGFRALGLETQNTNVPAIRFYKKCGFEIEGIDLSFYSNHDATDGEVAFFMRKKIK